MPLIETGDDWPEEIIRAAREDELAIFVGNGLTRLSNGPSWGDIFDRKDVQEFLENNNLDRSNLLYSELADILERREQSIWRNIRIKLRDDCGRLTHNSCHQVLKHIIIRSDSSKKRVVTTNIDSLLDDVGFAKTILRLHGSNDRIDDWVFTYSKYVEHAGRIQDAFSHVRAQFILFVGYGHSPEDVDIIRCAEWLAKSSDRQMYSLHDEHEMKRGGMRDRLQRSQIKDLIYPLGIDASTEDRETMLAHALLALAQKIAGQPSPELDQLVSNSKHRVAKLRARSKEAVVAMGLAAENRHIYLSEAIPDGGRRHSVRAPVIVECGGPALIVSKILACAGVDVRLISKIASDPPGQKIIRNIQSINANKRNGRIFTDFLDIARPEAGPDGFQTWQSVIIEPNRTDLNRVFLDRQVPVSKMRLSQRVTSSASSLIRDDSPRVLYFDKYFRDGIDSIITSSASDLGEKIGQNTWTVYETGSEGDRYGRTSPGASYNPEEAYAIENKLNGRIKYINVVTASFRFARDYLARLNGKLGDDDYDSLLHDDDSDEIRAGRSFNRRESAVIKTLLAPESDALLKKFIASVQAGSEIFLRNHPVRFVTVTLHEFGCLMLGWDSSGDPWFRHMPGATVKGRRYTASAGDVFRGALVAALALAQKRGLAHSQVVEKDFLCSIGRLANDCAALKIESATVDASLEDISTKIRTWAEERLT